MKKRKVQINKNKQKWMHPGGKLRENGSESLTDVELLAIFISTGENGVRNHFL